MTKRIQSAESHERVRRETLSERNVHRVEHKENERELKTEQKELRKTIRELEKELKRALKENASYDEYDSIRDRITRTERKRKKNEVGIDILRELVKIEGVGAELKKFLSEPKNVFYITLFLLMVPGTGLQISQINKIPELMLAMTGLAATEVIATSTLLYALIRQFEESKKIVQNRIDHLRDEFEKWQSSPWTYFERMIQEHNDERRRIRVMTATADAQVDRIDLSNL